MTHLLVVESFTRLFARFAVMSAVVPTSTSDNYSKSGPSNNAAQTSLDRDALGNRLPIFREQRTRLYFREVRIH